MIPTQSRPDVLLRQSGLKASNFDALYDYFTKNANVTLKGTDPDAIVKEQSIRERQLVIRFKFSPFTPAIPTVVNIINDIGINNVTLEALIPISQGSRLVPIYQHTLTIEALREIVQNLWNNDPLEDVVVYLRTSNILNTATTLESSRPSTYRNQANFRIAGLSSLDRVSLKLISFDFNASKNLDANYSLVNINAQVYSQSLSQTLDFRTSIQMGQLINIRAAWKDSGGLVSVVNTPVFRTGGSSAVGRVRLGAPGTSGGASRASNLANRTTIFIPAASTKIQLSPNPQPL